MAQNVVEAFYVIDEGQMAAYVYARDTGKYDQVYMYTVVSVYHFCGVFLVQIVYERAE
jgi:hypothetical protein